MRKFFIAGFAALALAGCQSTATPFPSGVADLEAQFRNECALLNGALAVGSLLARNSEKYATAQALVLVVCSGTLPSDLAYAITLLRNARKV